MQLYGPSSYSEKPATKFMMGLNPPHFSVHIIMSYWYPGLTMIHLLATIKPKTQLFSY